MTWYNKIYKGRHAQYLWQISIGINTFLLFIVIPKGMNYVLEREGKKYLGSSASRGTIVKINSET